MENTRPDFDKEIKDIAQYVLDYKIESPHAFQEAKLCLLDSLACALMALSYPDCTKLLGPIVPNAFFTEGARVPGTSFILEPVQAAFNIGSMIRWLDFNDTWLAKEWGHPSDNLGALLAMSDYLSRHHKKLTLFKLWEAMIKAHEIQGILALDNSFNQVGLDHVILVKVASAAVCASLLDCTFTEICNAISLAFVDGQSLRTYRHAPNTGSRKSWAAGDATSRGLRLALMAKAGEMGYPSALTAPKWGFYDVSFKGQPFKFQRTYGSYVMENILYKISFPAEFHAQTAVECAILLYPDIKNRLDAIEKIVIKTQESALRIIDKKGPLYNHADRDHCIQYMTAIGLIYGELTAAHYEDAIAKDPRIDLLRAKMEVIENPNFSKDYLDPNKRSIGNTVQVFFKDGSSTQEISIEYPVGHPKRRDEGIPLLNRKFEQTVRSYFPTHQSEKILNLSKNLNGDMLVAEFMDYFVLERPQQHKEKSGTGTHAGTGTFRSAKISE